MSDPRPDHCGVAAETDAGGARYPSRVRVLLGMPHPVLVALAPQLPSLGPLLFASPPSQGPYDRDGSGSFFPAEPSPAGAPVQAEAAAWAEGSSVSAAGSRSRGDISAAADLRAAAEHIDAVPAPVQIDLRGSGTAKAGVEVSQNRRLDPERPPRSAEASDPGRPDVVAGRAPVAEAPEATIPAGDGDTRAPAPLEHVSVAIPGGSTAGRLSGAETWPQEAALSAALSEPADGARRVQTPMQSPPVARNQPVPDRYRTAVPEMSAADARDPSAQLPGPSAHVAQTTPRTTSDGSDRTRLPGSVVRPNAASAEWESPPPPNLPARSSRSAVAFDNGREGDGLFAPEGARAGSAGVGVSGTDIFRRRFIEDLVPVPSREARGFERLEKKVQGLEARLNEQRARPQQAARPEPGAPRFVLVDGRPAAAPAASRAYWERSHLRRIGLRPRR